VSWIGATVRKRKFLAPEL
jgi:hypothetical protein